MIRIFHFTLYLLLQINKFSFYLSSHCTSLHGFGLVPFKLLILFFPIFNHFVLLPLQTFEFQGATAHLEVNAEHDTDVDCQKQAQVGDQGVPNVDQHFFILNKVREQHEVVADQDEQHFV
jgi:hypothetical protein